MADLSERIGCNTPRISLLPFVVNRAKILEMVVYLDKHSNYMRFVDSLTDNRNRNTQLWSSGRGKWPAYLGTLLMESCLLLKSLQRISFIIPDTNCYWKGPVHDPEGYKQLLEELVRKLEAESMTDYRYESYTTRVLQRNDGRGFELPCPVQ